MVIRLGSRRDNAVAVQKVLTDKGCNIKARLGLHEAGDVCSDEGLLILHLCGDEPALKELEGALNALADVSAKLVIL
jgi:hypothetical protein